MISKQISFSAGSSNFLIRAQLGSPDTCQCLARIIVDLCALARLGCAGGHQTSGRSPSVFAIRSGVCANPTDAGNTFRGGDKRVRVRARSGLRTTEGRRARIHVEVGCSQTAVFASERVTESCQKKRGWGVPINLTCNAGKGGHSCHIESNMKSSRPI